MRLGRCWMQDTLSVGPTLSGSAVKYKVDKGTSSLLAVGGVKGTIEPLGRCWELWKLSFTSSSSQVLTVFLGLVLAHWCAMGSGDPLQLAPMGWAPGSPRLSGDSVMRKCLFLIDLRVFHKSTWKGKPTRAASKGSLATPSAKPCTGLRQPWARSPQLWGWAVNIFHGIKKKKKKSPNSRAGYLVWQSFPPSEGSCSSRAWEQQADRAGICRAGYGTSPGIFSEELWTLRDLELLDPGYFVHNKKPFVPELCPS